MSSLYAIGAIILTVVGVIALAYVRGRSAGKDAIAAQVAEHTADNLRAQDKAGAEAAGEDVVTRLRKGGF